MSLLDDIANKSLYPEIIKQKINSGELYIGHVFEYFESLDRISFPPRAKGKKNKGIKHRVRGQTYRLEGKTNKIKEYTDLDKYIYHIKSKISALITRETPSDIYILCPYHPEKTGSMTIYKKILPTQKSYGMCKCFGCGKVVNFDIMYEQTGCKPKKHKPKKQIISEDLDLPF